MLLLAFTGFSQDNTLPFDLEDGTVPFLVFDCGAGGCPTGNNIDNPDTTNNPSAKVYEYVRNTGVAWYSGFVFDSSLRTTPLINVSSDGKIFRLKIWSTKAPIVVRFQLEQGFPTPGDSPSYVVDQTLNTANAWVELTFDFSSTPLADDDQYNAITIFPDWDPANQTDEDATDTYYFDDIEAVGAAPPTCTDGIQNGNETGVDCGGPDCPPCPPSCTDGIQNGSETGVDCGGPDCPPCPPSDPTDGPGNASSTGSDFIIYGEDGSNGNSDFTGFNLVDFAGGVAISQPDLNGDTVLRVDNLDFFGSGFGENFNAVATYSFVHINYYATTSTAFNFSLVDDSLSATVCCGNPEEPFYRFGTGGEEPIVNGSWQSVFIPLSHFATFPALVSGVWDGTDLKQTLYTGNGTVFIDNVFFSTTNTLSNPEFANIEFKVYPNPTENNWTIVSNSPVSLVKIYDVLGKEVLTVSPNQAVSTVDASSLKTGVYFASITTDAGTESVKLVKN